MTELASQALDSEGGVDNLEWIALKVHLLVCPPCRRFARQSESIALALRRIEAVEELPGPALPPEVRERIQREIDGQSETRA
jgi:hypothetical protein